MGLIKGNNWYYKGNELSRSLRRFYNKIELKQNGRVNYFELQVINGELDTLVFNFYNLGDAISFVENVIDKCQTFEEIISKYQELCANNQLENPQLEINQELKDTKMTLTEEQVAEAIARCFGEGKNYNVSVSKELGTDFNGNPTIRYYLIEHLDYEEIKRDNRILLTNADIKRAIEYYLNDLNYDVIGFKYIGGVHRIGYFFDEETPYYEGVEVELREKEKPYRLIKKRDNKDEERN
jgi:hypothetical protein